MSHPDRCPFCNENKAGERQLMVGLNGSRICADCTLRAMEHFIAEDDCSGDLPHRQLLSQLIGKEIQTESLESMLPALGQEATVADLLRLLEIDITQRFLKYRLNLARENGWDQEVNRRLEQLKEYKDFDD